MFEVAWYLYPIAMVYSAMFYELYKLIRLSRF